MSVTMRQMLEPGVHSGHQPRFWNPKMAPFIFGHRNKIHIVNLEKSLPLFQEAQKFVRQLAANKGNVLFVGTKRAARDIVREEAQRAGLPYVLFIIDVGYQKGAVVEAKKLGIPVIGVVDTNNSPEGVDYIVPGNDDSARAIRLDARGMADAALEGRAPVIREIVGGEEFVEMEEEEEQGAPAAE